LSTRVSALLDKPAVAPNPSIKDWQMSEKNNTTDIDGLGKYYPWWRDDMALVTTHTSVQRSGNVFPSGAWEQGKFC